MGKKLNKLTTIILIFVICVCLVVFVACDSNPSYSTSSNNRPNDSNNSNDNEIINLNSMNADDFFYVDVFKSGVQFTDSFNFAVEVRSHYNNIYARNVILTVRVIAKDNDYITHNDTVNVSLNSFGYGKTTGRVYVGRSGIRSCEWSITGASGKISFN